MTDTRSTPKSPSSPVLQIMLRKFAAEHKDSGTMADAMRDAADEIDRLNRWADTYSDAALKERALAEARIRELEDQLRATRSESERTFAPPPAMVRAALLVLLGHVDPGWDNCKWVVQAWLDGKLDPNTPPAEAPPGYRTGKRRLIYNKLTKQIDVVTTEGFVVDSFDPPQEVG